MTKEEKRKLWDSLTSGEVMDLVSEYVPSRPPAITSSKDLINFLFPVIKKHPGKEVFYGVFLNAKNGVLAIEALSEGTLTQSAIYPREVVKRCLDLNAAAVIFVHNHPGGDADPSAEDTAITRRLLFACRLLGITVHEHLIIAEYGNYSYADNGYIAQLNREFETGGAL